MGTILSCAIAGWPFVLPNILSLLRRHKLQLACFRGRIWRIWYTVSRRYLHYPSVLEEDRYWRSAHRSKRILDQSNGHHIPENVPIVRYYTPGLLPAYRLPMQRDMEAIEFRLSARTFCKWHRMVFPGPVSSSAMSTCKSSLTYSATRRSTRLRNRSSTLAAATAGKCGG